MTMMRNMAVLVANGFNEADFIAIQKMMREIDVKMTMVSANQGLVNGWNGTSWGHNFAVDVQLNTALGVDYDGLIVMSGERSHQKLMTTAHTQRFINSIVDAHKPVIVVGDAKAMFDSMGIMMGDHVMAGDWSEEFAHMVVEMLHNHSDIKQAA